MKGQVPGRVPRILPLVGHREHVGIVEMRPFGIASALAFGRRGRLGGIAPQPLRHVIVKELFGPDQTGQRLALDPPQLGVGQALLQPGVKLVGFVPAPGDDGVEIRESTRCRREVCRCGDLLEPQSHAGAGSTRQAQRDVERGFGSGLPGIYRGFLSGDEVLVEGILEIAGRVGPIVKPARVGFVVAEQRFRAALITQPVLAQSGVPGEDGVIA